MVAADRTKCTHQSFIMGEADFANIIKFHKNHQQPNAEILQWIFSAATITLIPRYGAEINRRLSAASVS